MGKTGTGLKEGISVSILTVTKWPRDLDLTHFRPVVSSVQ